MAKGDDENLEPTEPASPWVDHLCAEEGVRKLSHHLCESWLKLKLLLLLNDGGRRIHCHLILQTLDHDARAPVNMNAQVVLRKPGEYRVVIQALHRACG